MLLPQKKPSFFWCSGSKKQVECPRGAQRRGLLLVSSPWFWGFNVFDSLWSLNGGKRCCELELARRSLRKLHSLFTTVSASSEESGLLFHPAVGSGFLFALFFGRKTAVILGIFPRPTLSLNQFLFCHPLFVVAWSDRRHSLKRIPNFSHFNAEGLHPRRQFVNHEYSCFIMCHV